MAVGSSPVSGVDTSGPPCYADFHHRACALHMLCASFFDRTLSLPAWLSSMASTVAYQWEGITTRERLVAKGVASTASLQHGIVKLSWLDIVMEVINGGEAFGDSLQASVLKSCPEHAASVADWQHMKALTTRVSVVVYDLIAQYMQEVLTPCWARPCDGWLACACECVCLYAGIRCMLPIAGPPPLQGRSRGPFP